MRVKVWSVTKSRDREFIGDVITNWLQESRALPSETIVLQSSDSAFHCLSFVMFYDLPVDLPKVVATFDSDQMNALREALRLPIKK